MTSARNYIATQLEDSGKRWNQFWFSPSKGHTLILLRQLIGMFALAWLAAFSFQLLEMFGENGWSTIDLAHSAPAATTTNSLSGRLSHLYWIRSDTWIWITHVICLLINLAMVCGIAPRVTTPLTFLVVLSYVHRAPLFTSAFESVLCMLLLYLSLGPKQNAYQLWRQNNDDDPPTWRNTVALRLIQIHLCAFYLLIATSKLGTPDWWSGVAVWYLLTDHQHRLMNLDSLTASQYLMDAVSHSWIALELFFPVLVWIDRLKPAVLVVATIAWLLTGVVTGQVAYCLIMCVANLAFISPSKP